MLYVILAGPISTPKYIVHNYVSPDIRAIPLVLSYTLIKSPVLLIDLTMIDALEAHRGIKLITNAN